MRLNTEKNANIGLHQKKINNTLFEPSKIDLFSFKIPNTSFLHFHIKLPTNLLYFLSYSVFY